MLKSEWLDGYTGTLAFHGSLPLEDIAPPPANPHVDTDDRTPFAVAFRLSIESGHPLVWLRIDGGPMQTAATGETLRFGRLSAGVARLIGSNTKSAPLDATLTVRPDSFGTESLFTHAAGGFWRRHFTARFSAAGADMIVWVFDADGTRARTWRGAAVRQS